MKKIFSTIIAILLVFSLSAETYNMKQLGADLTGKTKNTELINQTIDKANAEGGGTLYFPSGTYLTAAIHMKSNVTLHIEAGATLLFSDKFEDYLPFVYFRWEGTFMNSFSPLIYARGAENISIVGRGKIDGQGSAWWNAYKPTPTQNEEDRMKAIAKYQDMWRAQNKDVVVSEYYNKTIDRCFFRPPLIQFLECDNILIEGITVTNSPFWTINPVGCNNVVVHGVTVNNPSKDPKGPNTDGINPSSCKNVRISDCFISVGDDCITIKSGRDADGRRYGRPCENITITNCVMLSGHGGVVIGSEMSGGAKKITISNCVFDGTDAGIRLKASRGRGGIVEEIRVNNIIMNNIQRNAFIFDLFYDKTSRPEPITDRTPVFRNIHISNVTGSNINKIGYITGIEEMPIEEISFSNINLVGVEGFYAKTAKNIQFHNVDFAVEKGASFSFDECQDIVLNNVRSKQPIAGQAVVEIENTKNAFVNNCFPIVATDIFLQSKGSEIVWGNNFMNNAKEPHIKK